MLWLQKTPNGKAGFRHTWRVKWSPSPGRIGQMVAVRLITIACKMEASLLSSLTKRLSFPAMLSSPSTLPLLYICLLLQPLMKAKMLCVIWISYGMCGVTAAESRQTKRNVGSTEWQSWTPVALQWRSPGQLRAQLITASPTFGDIQTGHIVNRLLLPLLLPSRPPWQSRVPSCLLAISIHLRVKTGSHSAARKQTGGFINCSNSLKTA